MQKLAGSALLITIFTLVGQAVMFAIQVVTAALFGAQAGMDAFLAASTVPQYIIAVLLGSLGIVFVPVFIEYLTVGREEEAWQIASSVINLALLGLGGLVFVGIMFPKMILSIIAPGLTEASLLQATQIAVITWPSVLATGLVFLLAGIYQAKSHFGWPAAVPVLGSFSTLGLILVLVPHLGIIGLAIANTFGIVLQAGLLLPFALKHGRYRPILAWQQPGVRQVLQLLLPLVLANVVAKSTPLVDRFFASNMPEGSISHLGYAFRVFSVLSLLISTGISTAIFPRMASNAASQELANLRQIMSTGLRVMWLAIAPSMTIGSVLALPLVTVVFRRGQFSMADAVAVSRIFQIYLLALPAACLGSVTARGFYALKDTRTVALWGSVESVAYVFYAAVLAQTFGVFGLALSYVMFFNVSLAWQVLVVRHKSGKVGGRTVINSFVRTGLAAILGGGAAWWGLQIKSAIWWQLALGALSGLFVYVIALWILHPSEAHLVWNSLRKGRDLKGTS